MNTKTFKTNAALIRAHLVKMEEAREDLALLCASMKLATGLTNMQMREVKRLLKADVKGTMDKIEEQDEASEFIRGLLGIDKKNVEQISVDHDPETGEVIAAPSFNGRTAEFGSADAGSTPAGAANTQIAPPDLSAQQWAPDPIINGIPQPRGADGTDLLDIPERMRLTAA